MGETNCGYGLVTDWSTCFQNEFEAHGAKWSLRSSRNWGYLTPAANSKFIWVSVDLCLFDRFSLFQVHWALRDPVSGLVPDWFRTGLTTLGMIRSVLFTFVCFPDWFRTNWLVWGVYGLKIRRFLLGKTLIWFFVSGLVVRTGRSL